ncbi:MAG: hypothetical protein IKP15_01475 [Bacteroidales bacterium]|nr:hypothetical protein [Bacteroidales bacterium]
MCKKSIIALLAALPLLFACGNPPRNANAVREERRIPELIAAVPSDALAVICYDRASEGMQLLDSTNVLQQLDLTAFKNARMALSLCYNGSLVPVLALDAGRVEADSVSAVNTLLAQASTLRLQAEYVRPDPDAKRRGFVLITPSNAQLTAVRRHLTEYTSILDAPGFRQALAAAGGQDFIIFRGGGAPERLAPKGWLQEFFPRRELTRFLGTVADWTVLTPAGDGFQVAPVCERDDAFYANILASLPFGESRLGAILPQDVRFALALPVALPELRKAVVRWQDASVKLTAYEKQLAALRKESGKDPLKWEQEVNVREVALVHFGGGVVALVRPAKPATEREPYENPRRGFLPALYGNAFALADDSCTACSRGWQIYGSPEAVEAFIAAERPEEPVLDWPGRGCRFIIHQPGKTLAWGKKGIRLIWNSTQ